MIVYTLYPVAGEIPIDAKIEARIPGKVIAAREVCGRRLLTVDIGSVSKAEFYYEGQKIEAEK